MRVAIVIAVVALGSSAQLSAQAQRISGALAQELRSGDISERHLTPDGTRLVYRANRSADTLNELFSVPTDGSGPSVRLSDPLPAGGSVRFGSSIGAGDRVVFVADPSVAGDFHVFSVPADGSASPTLLSPTSAFSYWLNAPGDRVFYRDPGDVVRSVPIDGSVPASTFVTSPKPLIRLIFGPDGATLVLVTIGDLDTYRLYSMPADGSAPPTQLYQTPAGRFLDSERFAPDGVHLLFELVQIEGIFYPNYLFSVRLDGSAPAVQLSLSSSYVPNSYLLEETSVLDRVALQDGETMRSIAYDGTQRVDLDPPGWSHSFEGFDSPPLAIHGGDVVSEAVSASGRALVRAPLDGSQAGVPLFAASSIESFSDPVILASGKVVYTGDGGLYVVPLAGGTPLLLNPPPSRKAASIFQVDASEQTVVFASAGDMPFKAELYAVPLDGSAAPRKLNALLGDNGDVSSFLLDGAAAIYSADPLVDNLDGAFRAPLDGLGPVIQLNEPTPGSAIGGDVLEFQTKGTLAVYRADGSADESFGLFAVDTDAPQTPTLLTALLPAEESVLAGFALSPAGERVAFRTQGPSRLALYSATTAPSAPLELDASTLDLPVPILVTPDGARVVYRKGSASATDYALWSAPLDGSSPAIALHPPLGLGRSVVDFQLSADGRRAVYRADAALDQLFELFSVPVDGSAPPVRLHQPLAAGRSVPGYQISPDAKHVVFRADLQTAGKLELFSVPIDGALSPAKLSGPLPADRDVLDFTIAPDGSRVAFRANVLNAFQYDLFSATLDGRRPPLRRIGGETRVSTVERLSQLIGGRSVEGDYRFTPDSTRVLFRYYPSNVGLFRAEADGSGAAVRLSATMPGNRGVMAFDIGSDGEHVVYLADATQDEVFELYRVSLAGGPVVALDQDPLPAFADVSAFRIDPDSAHVVYRGDRNADNVFELFRVGLGGASLPERLNRPLPAGGDVESDFGFLPDGHVLYRADQATNDVLELFLTVERHRLRR